MIIKNSLKKRKAAVREAVQDFESKRGPFLPSPSPGDIVELDGLDGSTYVALFLSYGCDDDALSSYQMIGVTPWRIIRSFDDGAVLVDECWIAYGTARIIHRAAGDA